jgi:hypothetical protein
MARKAKTLDDLKASWDEEDKALQTGPVQCFKV